MSYSNDQIKALIARSDRAVERALVAIYDRQTQDEKRVSDTRHFNKIGFSAAHAKKGSYYARWVNSGRNLTGYHLDRARSIAMHYARQLAEIANERNS